LKKLPVVADVDHCNKIIILCTSAAENVAADDRNSVLTLIHIAVILQRYCWICFSRLCRGPANDVWRHVIAHVRPAK